MTTTNSSAVEWFLNNQRMTSHTKDQTPEQGALQSAQDYAMAEQTARERGWWVTWELDQTQDAPGDQTASLWGDNPTEEWGDPDLLASLGGIEQNATQAWKRAIEAELAFEAIEAGN